MGRSQQWLVWFVQMLTGVAVVGLVWLIVPAHSPAVPRVPQGHHKTAHCQLPFHARVYQGPDTGVELAGDLTLTIDPSGSHRGVLTQPDGSGVSVVGHVTGQSLTVLFDLGDGRFISGLGTADSDIRACTFTTLLGPFVGPDVADSGTWRFIHSITTVAQTQPVTQKSTVTIGPTGISR